MQRLPPLAFRPVHGGRVEWRLPIPDEVAVVLPACLLATGQARVEALAGLLRRHAPLALWVALRAAQRGIRAMSCEQLAEWFAVVALSELTLDGSDGQGRTGLRPVLPSSRGTGLRPILPGSGAPETPPAQHARWARMSAAAVFVAGQVASAAERAGWPASEVAAAYLAGLLHDASTWLRTSRWEQSAPGTPEVADEAADEVADEAAESGWLQSLNLAGAVPDRHQLADWIAAAASVERLSPIAPPAAAPPEECSVAAAVSADLANHWLEMIESLRRGERTEQEFQRALEREKLAAMKELAYGASHEINNPLANISTRAQSLLRDERDPERRRKLATMNAQALRAHEMISDLMLFAHPPAPQIAVVDLVGLVRKVIDECQGESAAQATELRFAAAVEDLRVEADATLVEAAVHAVCRNALESLVGGGVVEASVRSEAETWARIEIRDNGPGLSDEQRRHAFDPFYSGREAGRGLGLGLSKCWRIAELHGGQIEIASQPGLGTLVALSFPLPAASAAGELPERKELR